MSQSTRIEQAIGTNRLLRRSVWCGVVLALAVVISALNALPPVAIDYEVTTRLLVSQPRLAQINEQARSDAATWFKSSEPIRIREVRELDSVADVEVHAEEALTLVEVSTVWRRPHDERLLEEWLRTASRPPVRTLAGEELTRKSNFAKWQLRAAQHYKAQLDYLGPRGESLGQNQASSASQQTSSALQQTSSAGKLAAEQKPDRIAETFSGASSYSNTEQPTGAGHTPEILRVTPQPGPRPTFTLASSSGGLAVRQASMQTEVAESPATMDDLDNSASQPASRGFTLGQHSKFTDEGTDAGQAPSGDMVSAILASTELPESAETLANTVWSDGSGDDLAAVQDTSTQMEREIAKRQRELRTLAGEMIRKSDQAAGVIEFSEASRVRPLSHPIPLWMAASVLLLGVFSAASASWLQQRLHAGGVYDPRQLVATLRQAGLPVVDMVELSSDWETPNGMLSRMRLRASQTARRIASNMTLACEWVLWFWVYTLAIRLVLDSMWRQVLFDNPLAALGRILWGLP